MSANIVGRFAPSPSGYLHIGNLLAMLLAWLDCRSLGGELIFRMEDLDPARSKRAYIDALAEDLRWLGLDWDRGWPDPAYAQSKRTARYEGWIAPRTPGTFSSVRPISLTLTSPVLASTTFGSKESLPNKLS